MRVIIAGSRTIASLELVQEAITESGFLVKLVISGTAKGIDRLGEEWAASIGVPVLRMPADWERFGKGAGPKRNEAMLALADAVIVVWDGYSFGSRHMIRIAQRSGKPLYIKKLWRVIL